MTPDPKVERPRAEIEEKEAQLQALRAELEEEKERTTDLETSRRAMLDMLEELNESTAIIKRGKQEWETTFDSISEPIFIHDREFNILRANRAYSEAAGLPFHEIIGRPYFRVFPIMEGPFDSCVKVVAGEEKEMEEEITLPSGKSFKLCFYLVRDDHGKYLFSVHVMEDITEKKLAATEKVLLYEKITEEAEVSSALLKMVETLNTSLDERDLLRNVMTLVPDYLGFDRVAIFFYDGNTRGFTYAAGYGLTPPEEGDVLSRVFKEDEVPALAGILKGETVVLENAARSGLMGKDVVETFHVGSAVMVPLSFRGKVVGGIYGDYREITRIEKKEVALLKGLADGVAVALQNSRLYRESVERLMELSGKVETIKAMAHLDKEILSNIERDSILGKATALINRVIPAERAAVALEEGDRYRIVSEWGAGEFRSRTYPVKGSYFEAFRKNRISFYLDDISASKCPYHKELNAIGIRSVLLVPLVTKKGVIGFLDVGSAHNGRLTPDHLSTAENIASQIAVALENAGLYEELGQLFISTVSSLASAIDAKSPWTQGHSERVTHYALKIGREIGLKAEELERLRLSGLLHDVGKIGTYDVLLDKPGSLTDEEFALVKKHPRKGAEILAPIRQLSDVIPGILHHHERYDGRGYPDGLKGEQIPFHARILCVADSFDSMTADRPYRASPGLEYALSEFRRCRGTQFDPEIVDTFLELLGRNGTARTPEIQR